jgi:hypothetical protein
MFVHTPTVRCWHATIMCELQNVRANFYSLLLTCYNNVRVTECSCKLLQSAADMLQYCASYRMSVQTPTVCCWHATIMCELQNVHANSYNLLLTCYSIVRFTECPCKLLQSAADMLQYCASYRMSVKTPTVCCWHATVLYELQNVRANSYILLLTSYCIVRVTECPFKLVLSSLLIHASIVYRSVVITLVALFLWIIYFSLEILLL